jgi:hypothetical protein
VKVVVIHGREFKGGEQIKHVLTEFGIANDPAHGPGVLCVEDDDGVMLLLVMRCMVTDAIAGVGVKYRHDLQRPGRASFVAAVGIAIAIESVGAFAYTGVTDAPIYAVPSGPDKLQAAWEWRNAPFVASLSRGLAPAEITLLPRGAIETFEINGRATDTVEAGHDVVASGWALAGSATPLQVGIMIDGLETTAVRTFYDRPDIRSALPGTGAAGWDIPLKMAGLAAGEHRLSLYLWASEKGDAYFLTRRTLTVRAPEKRN